MPQPGRRNRLAELAEYDRPWVGRVGLALVLLLWLFVSAVSFGVGVGVGLAVTIGGGTLILGEVWLERSGERHATLSVVWHLSWRVGMGAVLIVMAVVSSDGWGAVLLAAFGGLLVLPALVLAPLWLRETREKAAGGDT
jgi:hypothetical protein